MVSTPEGFLAASPEHHLALAPFLSVVDAAQSVCQRVHPHHGGSGDLLSANHQYVTSSHTGDALSLNAMLCSILLPWFEAPHWSRKFRLGIPIFPSIEVPPSKDGLCFYMPGNYGKMCEIIRIKNFSFSDLHVWRVHLWFGRDRVRAAAVRKTVRQCALAHENLSHFVFDHFRHGHYYNELANLKDAPFLINYDFYFSTWVSSIHPYTSKRP